MKDSWPPGQYNQDLVEGVRSTRALTRLLGKLNIGKDIFYRDNSHHVRKAIVKPRPPWPAWSQFGLGLKEAKDWYERYTAKYRKPR